MTAAEITQRAMDRGAAQKPPELERLVEMLQEHCPWTVMEIGTMDGGTLSAWCDCTDPAGLIVSVDLPGGQWGGGYDARRAQHIRGFAGPTQTLTLIQGDSQAERTRERVLWELDGELVDFLFIDGDHSYEGVKADFETYSSIVRPDGLIAFHDISHHPLEGTVEVERFWGEIKDSFRAWEFCVAGHERSWGPWGGIGVVQV